MTLDDEINGMNEKDIGHKGKDTKKRHNGIKTTVLGLSLMASAYLGDFHNVNDRFVNPILYHNHDTAEYFSSNPFELEKRVVVNDEGEIETYFGSRDSDDLYRVRANDHTANMLDDVVDGSRRQVGNMVDYVRDNFFRSE